MEPKTIVAIVLVAFIILSGIIRYSAMVSHSISKDTV